MEFKKKKTKLKTGDIVSYRNKEFRVLLNGSPVYLYDKTDINMQEGWLYLTFSYCGLPNIHTTSRDDNSPPKWPLPLFDPRSKVQRRYRTT